MSFLKIGGRNPPRKKRTARKKPWNDTVNDLDAYKATPEEIEYRKASHRSKHAVYSHLTRPGSARKGKRASPLSKNAQTRKIALMKEVLYDQKQLQEVLERSDTMMAVVKDLFGDDPRRFAGIPSVTTAPHVKDTDVASSLINLPAEMRTRSEELSDSVMDMSALNELQHSDSDLDESGPGPLTYQPKINMQRFQQFIESQEKNTTLSTISGHAGLSHLEQTLANQQRSNRNIQSSQLPDQTAVMSKDGSFQTPPKSRPDANESLEMLQPPKSAMNDTNKINRTKRRVPKPVPEQNTSNLSLNELRKVLETLEDEVAEYERQTGRRPPAEKQRQESFSGYTLAIVDSVTKLTRYLRESELRLNMEITIREQLAQDVVQFKALVDALTSDIILTQEEFHQMASEFQRFRQETRAEFQRLKGQSNNWSPAQSLTSNPAMAAEPTVNSNNNNNNCMSKTPPRSEHFKQNLDDVEDRLQVKPAQMFGEHLKPVSAAVLLSPPVRRSRVVEPTWEMADNQQRSLLDLQDYVSTVDSNNSALQEDYADLPGTLSLAEVINYSTASQNVRVLQGHTTKSLPQSRPVTTAVNSVNVPRPTPLVQSNVDSSVHIGLSGNQSRNSQLAQSFYEKHRTIAVKPNEKPQTLLPALSQNSAVLPEQSINSKIPHDVSEMGSADKEFLATQIAELNKQHAEAQKRLVTLIQQQQTASVPESVQQRPVVHTQQQNTLQSQDMLLPSAQQHSQQVVAQKHSQQARQQVVAQQQSQQARQQVVAQQQSQQARQQVVAQQQTQQARQQVVDNQLRLQQQQLQYEQQQKLLQLVMQQQQRIQDQQQKKQQQTVNGQQSESVFTDRTQRAAELDRQNVQMPGYIPRSIQPGLPAYPVSPNISPISERSERVGTFHKSVHSQNLATGRGIMVSIPTVDMDQSACSISPRV